MGNICFVVLGLEVCFFFWRGVKKKGLNWVFFFVIVGIICG